MALGRIALGIGLAGLCATAASAQTEVATGPFTPAQVETGRKAYTVHCAGCHSADLAGQGGALPLAGRMFMAGWGNQTTQALYKVTRNSMPKPAPGSLDDAVTADITAFILYANGAKPGPTAFLAAPPLRIDLVANGIAPGDLGTAPR